MEMGLPGEANPQIAVVVPVRTIVVDEETAPSEVADEYAAAKEIEILPPVIPFLHESFLWRIFSCVGICCCRNAYFCDCSAVCHSGSGSGGARECHDHRNNDNDMNTAAVVI